MIDLRAQEIKFGTGDVGAGLTYAGTSNAPVGKAVFFNQAPKEIKGVSPDDPVAPFETQTFYRSDYFILSFTNPESIDVVISILERVKETTFGPDTSLQDEFFK